MSFLSGLVHAYQFLSKTLLIHEQYDASYSAAAKAIAVEEILVKRQPGVPEHKAQLMSSLVTLSGNVLGRNNYAEAIRALERSVELKEELLNEYPLNHDFHIAQTPHTALGLLLYTREQHEKAREVLKNAISLYEEMVTRHPSQVAHQVNLTMLLTASGTIMFSERNYAEANRYFEKALTIVKELEATETLDPRFPISVNSIEQKTNLSRYALRAMMDMEFVLAQTPELAAQLLFYRGSGLVELGNHASAAESGEKLVELKVPDDQPDARGLNLYSAACLLSLASGAAAKDEDLAEADRTALVDKYAVRAMELLTEARTAGWFQEAKNIAHAKDTDADLAPLRDRDDFKQLVKELEEELQE